jgi:hypothetical protein
VVNALHSNHAIANGISQYDGAYSALMLPSRVGTRHTCIFSTSTRTKRSLKLRTNISRRVISQGEMSITRVQTCSMREAPPTLYQLLISSRRFQVVQSWRKASRLPLNLGIPLDQIEVPVDAANKKLDKQAQIPTIGRRRKKAFERHLGGSSTETPITLTTPWPSRVPDYEFSSTWSLPARPQLRGNSRSQAGWIH